MRGQPRETSGVTSALLLAYLDREGGADAVAEVLSRCGLSGCEAELRDENCWFSWQTKIELFEATADVLDDPDFLVEMATLALDVKVGGGLKVALRTLGSPQLVYRSIVRANARFNGSHAMELISVGRGQTRTRFVDISGERRFHHLDCEYSAAMLSIVPELFGLPRAQLTHVACVGGRSRLVRVRAALARARVGRPAGGGDEPRRRSRVDDERAAAPGRPAGGGGAHVVGAGAVFRGEIGRRQHSWRQLQREAEDNADVAQRLFASLQDLVSDLQLEEVLGKVTRNAQAAVGGREFALLVREGEGFVCQSTSGLPPVSIAALEAWANCSGRVADSAWCSTTSHRFRRWRR